MGAEVFVDLAVVALVLFFDPAGRPRFFGAELVLAVDVGALAAFADVVLFDPAGRPRFFGAADFTVFVAFDVAALVLLTAASAASAVDSLTLSAALLVFSTALLVAALAFSPAVFDRSRALRAAASAALRASTIGSILAVSDFPPSGERLSLILKRATASSQIRRNVTSVSKILPKKSINSTIAANGPNLIALKASLK